MFTAADSRTEELTQFSLFLYVARDRLIFFSSAIFATSPQRRKLLLLPPRSGRRKIASRASRKDRCDEIGEALAERERDDGDDDETMKKRGGTMMSATTTRETREASRGVSMKRRKSSGRFCASYDECRRAPERESDRRVRLERPKLVENC